LDRPPQVIVAAADAIDASKSVQGLLMQIPGETGLIHDLRDATALLK